ncbi:hypothetical protein EHS25_004393 [Saitozyma podzolica]|uniref:Large ribosomal subunit protein bL32m n=1 Tax=Saitozyma podzolica TaxID=1890683 RepID=A0A427YU54_9TREE|nr:hypothetical protein EHS25_004393 [Saitozyma podzolica]
MGSLAFALPTRSLPFNLPRLLRPSWSILCEPSTSASHASPVRTFTPTPSPSTSTPAASALISDALCTSTPTPTPVAAPAPWYTFLPGLSSLLELMPPILMAVPKHKVTHSRKSMRSANKGLKNRTNISNCEACGMPKLAHNICPNCYSQISRQWKKDARGQVTGNASGWGPSAPPA